MIKDTIFSPSFGNRPVSLVGREADVQSIIDGLQTRPGSKERACILLGQRGTGKTVLLWEVADRARDAGFVVATPTIVSDGMLGRIVEKIQFSGEKETKETRAHLSGGNVGALGFSIGLQFSLEEEQTKSFQYKLDQLARKLTEQGKGILILVDELQASSDEIRQLVIAYQELVGEGLNIALVMAGLPGAVSSVLNDKVLTFLNRAEKKSLQPLAFGDVDAFLKDSFMRLGITLSDNLRRQASQYIQGSPYLLQLVGHTIALYAPDDGYVDEACLKQALETAQEEFENDVCKTTLAALSEKDIEFLCAMEQVGCPAHMSDIAAGMKQTPDYAQKYRRRLLDAGIITSPSRGQVEFAVPYLEEYLSERF